MEFEYKSTKKENTKMKKLSFVMSLVLVLTALVGLFSVPASAAEYAADTVATVNGVEVTEENILDVILACPTGGTVNVIKDFSTFALIFQNSEETGITSKWVINGNNHTISSPITSLANKNYLLTTTSNYLEINDLTLITMGSGISVKSGSQVYLNNVNVYTGGTAAGQTTEGRAPYARAKSSAELNSIAVQLSATTRSTVYINGGTYKAYGVSGQVLAVDRGNMVVYDGNFVGEDCSFVARVKNETKQTNLSNVTASLTVYGGLFIKPIINKTAGQYNDDDTTKKANTNTDGCVIRGDAGGLVNIHGGTFACFSGKAKLADGTAFGTQRDFVLLGGISSGNDYGFINIFGGDFYSFMTADVNANKSQLIGNYSSGNPVNDADVSKVNTAIYGGNFYSTNSSREYNITAIASESTTSIQHVPADQYKTTESTVSNVDLYGKSFTNVTKWTVEYEEPSTAPAKATVKVTNSNGKNYYIQDYTHSSTGSYGTATVPAFAQAINGVADKDSTVTLLKDITITPTEILNRGQKMTIDGNNKTITSATNGLTVSSGEITVKNLTLVAGTAEGNYAFKIAKTAVNTSVAPDHEDYNATVDSYKLVLKLENCAFTGAIPVIDNPFLEGSVATTGCLANGNALNIAHTYTAPEPQAPVIDSGDEGEGEGEGGEGDGSTDTGATDNTTTDNNAATNDAPADNATTEKKGCKNSIGVGAVAIIAVAGAACGFVAKKRED